LLPLSSRVYSTDLRPDHRDTELVEQAFGLNLPRLARLKHICNLQNVLAYACPLLKALIKLKLIILVTGESSARKDYCTNVSVSEFNYKSVKAHAVSINDITKQEYTTATSADLICLVRDRAYKEEHRLALTRFFRDQVQNRPRLPEEYFLELVYSTVDVDVLFITGIRDKALLAGFSHLVAESRLIEVYIQASEQTRKSCKGYNNSSSDGTDRQDSNNSNARANITTLDYCPSLIFDNNTTGNKAAQ
jgi:hypothetical protein